MTRQTAEAAFRLGWRHLRESAPSAAATAFEMSLETSRDTPVSEDAAYWLGIAYARAKMHEKAITALDSFVRHYPDSPRLAEAFLAMGWTEVERGNREGAAWCFERAEREASSSKIQTRAAEGLAAIRQLDTSNVPTR